MIGYISASHNQDCFAEIKVWSRKTQSRYKCSLSLSLASSLGSICKAYIFQSLVRFCTEFPRLFSVCNFLFSVFVANVFNVYAYLSLKMELSPHILTCGSLVESLAYLIS